MKRIILIVACFGLLVMWGYHSPSYSEESSEQAGDSIPVPEIIYHHYADSVGDVIAYMYMPKGLYFAGHEEAATFCLAAIPSGEKFVEYECTNSMVFFSPDGCHVVKLLLMRVNEDAQSELVLCRTNDDEELWRVTIELEGKALPTEEIIWDYENDWLIGISGSQPEVEQIDDPDAHGKALMHALTPTTIRVFRISDGELLSEVEMQLVFGESLSFTMESAYGGGRLFVEARDDPFAEERDTSENKYDVYAIEPVTWKTERIDTRGMCGRYHAANILATKDGEKLFFQPGEYDPENKITLLGNDIIEINLITGEWKTLLQKGEDKVYELKGITPDGRKVICHEKSRDAERKLVYRSLILDVVTGKESFLEPGIETKFYFMYKISASGRYIIGSEIGHDIWVHDLETGEKHILASVEEYPNLWNSPGVPGKWNIRF